MTSLLPDARIGCPVRLVPRQMEDLWTAFVDTAIIAGLV